MTMPTIPRDEILINRHRSECPRLRGQDCSCQCRGCGEAWRDFMKENSDKAQAMKKRKGDA